MPEIVTCPECDRKLKVPESLAGKPVKCPSCGATFTASPGAAAPPPAPSRPAERAAASEDESDEMPAQRSKPARRPPAEDDYEEEEDRPRRRRPARDDDDDDEDDTGPRRRRRRFRRDSLPHRGGTILTLGVLSLICFGFILGPIAWIMGSNDLKEIRAGSMDPEGEGTTRAGMICGIIGTILGILGCVSWLLIFAAGGFGRI